MEFRLYSARFKQFHSPWASIGDVFTANSWVPHLVIVHESSRQDKAYHGSSSYPPRLKNVCAYVPGEGTGYVRVALQHNTVTLTLWLEAQLAKYSANSVPMTVFVGKGCYC